LLDQTGVERIWADEPDGPPRLGRRLDKAAIIVDALLGTGVSRPIEGSLAGLLRQVKNAIVARRAAAAGQSGLIEPAWPAERPPGPAVVAVDLPSGLNSDTGAVDPYTLPADLTVTLAAVKRGHILSPGLDVVGRLVVGDIGLTPDHYPDTVALEMATAAKAAALLPDRPPSSHKGAFGTALLVAGSKNYVGAAILAGRAAVRIGTGLVDMAVPATIQPVVAAAIAEAIYTPLPDQDGFIAPAAVQPLLEQATKAKALLIGSGLSQHKATAAFLKDILAQAAKLPPLVLDADALNLLAKENEWWQWLPGSAILTPHPGEMGRLTGRSTADVQSNRLDLAPEMAAHWRQVVLLKGAHTVIAAPDGRLMVMPFANPAMAKAGSGDVLSGTIVGLLAQGLPPFEAAVAGAYLHGLAGELARQALGVSGVIAGDLINQLPHALRQVRGE
jgi:NAD(P)H-hydrate epimerase